MSSVHQFLQSVLQIVNRTWQLHLLDHQDQIMLWTLKRTHRQERSSMLIGGLIRVWILQLCRKEESCWLSSGLCRWFVIHFFFPPPCSLVNGHYLKQKYLRYLDFGPTFKTLPQWRDWLGSRVCAKWKQTGLDFIFYQWQCERRQLNFKKKEMPHPIRWNRRKICIFMNPTLNIWPFLLVCVCVGGEQ